MLSRIALSFVVGGLAQGAVINVPADQPDIQSAITAAVSGVDEVVVAPGSYVGILDLQGKAITVRSSGGAAVTTIDGGGAFAGTIRITSGEGADTVLEGFTVTGGNGLFGSGIVIDTASPTIRDCVVTGNSTSNNGGGIRINGGSPLVRGCTMTGNFGANGGGVYCENGAAPTIEGCLFDANDAPFGGGLACFSGSSPRVTGCVFRQNDATSQGGGAHLENASNAVFDGCRFEANTSDVHGGGVSCDGSEPVFLSCEFVANEALSWGGGVFMEMSDPIIINCTFFAGRSLQAGLPGGGGVTVISSFPTIDSCVFRENENSAAASPNESSQIHIASGSAFVNYSDVQGLTGGLGGVGNIDADPGFVDPLGVDGLPGTGDEDVHLLGGSPCIDAGDARSIALLSETDIDGEQRAVDDPATPDTGVGVFLLVSDMGSDEVQVAPCDGDADGNGVVDVNDIAFVIFRLGTVCL